MTTEEIIPMDTLAKIYIKIRNKIKAIEDEHETQLKALKAQQEEVAHAIKDQMLAMNSTSIKTEFGTAILSQKTRYSATDWDAFKDFVKKHDALDLFEKRIAQGNMKEFLEVHPGVVPPGLNSTTEYQVTVRKS